MGGVLVAEGGDGANSDATLDALAAQFSGEQASCARARAVATLDQETREQLVIDQCEIAQLSHRPFRHVRRHAFSRESLSDFGFAARAVCQQAQRRFQSCVSRLRLPQIPQAVVAHLISDPKRKPCANVKTQGECEGAVQVKISVSPARLSFERCYAHGQGCSISAVSSRAS